MDHSNRTQIKVGLYLVIGIICIFSTIFFLGANKSIFSKFTYVRAQFDQVQGLAEGSVISLAGVNVGNIQEISFSNDGNKLDITMRINNKFIERVRKDSQVEIRTQGALGDKYIFIFAGSKDSPRVEDGDFLSVATATDILGVISQRGSEAGKIFDVVNEFYKMAHTMNGEGRLNKIMKNFETASTNLSNTSKELDSIVTAMNQGKASGQAGQKVARSLEKLDSILNRIEKGEGTLGLLINDPSLHNQLKSMIGGSQRKTHLKSLLRTSIEKEEEQ